MLLDVAPCTVFDPKSSNLFQTGLVALGPHVKHHGVPVLEPTHPSFSLFFRLNLRQLPQKEYVEDFPGGTVVKNPPANAGDTGSIPGLGRSHMLRSN